jgi:uncharacterized protein DUF4242
MLVKSTFIRKSVMPMFLVERSFAEAIELHAEEASVLMSVNADIGITWLFSFLSADRKKTYCLYQAASSDLIREAARRAGIPADVVIEVTEQRPEWFGVSTPTTHAQSA